MSTETKHTKEPWEHIHVCAGEEVIRGELNQESPPVVAIAQSQINARRIVACVNACAGISDEQLEDDKLDVFLQALRISSLDAQNKELREAATEVVEAHRPRVLIQTEDKNLYTHFLRLNEAIIKLDKTLSCGG